MSLWNRFEEKCPRAMCVCRLLFMLSKRDKSQLILNCAPEITRVLSLIRWAVLMLDWVEENGTEAHTASALLLKG